MDLLSYLKKNPAVPQNFLGSSNTISPSSIGAPVYQLPNSGGSYNTSGLNPVVPPQMPLPTGGNVLTPQEPSALSGLFGQTQTPPSTSSSMSTQAPTQQGSQTNGGTEEYTPEQYAKLNELLKNIGGGQPMALQGNTEGLTSVALRNEQMRDRANGTGLYSIPKGMFATPEQILGIRKMADQHYANLIDTYSQDEKNKTAEASAKKPAYGLDSIFSNLSPQMVTKLSGEENDFRSEPIVKKFNIIQDAAIQAKQLGDRLGDGPSTGSDDQRLIYLFAKAQDPDSVVREGEYATTAKYISTLPMQAQAAISRVLNLDPTKRGLLSSAPTGFLTPEARKQVVAALQEQYRGNKNSYDNLRNEYSKRIDKYSGHSGLGDQMLVNYQGAYDNYQPEGSKSKSGGSLTWDNILD